MGKRHCADVGGLQRAELGSGTEVKGDRRRFDGGRISSIRAS